MSLWDTYSKRGEQHFLLVFFIYYWFLHFYEWKVMINRGPWADRPLCKNRMHLVSPAVWQVFGYRHYCLLQTWTQLKVDRGITWMKLSVTPECGACSPWNHLLYCRVREGKGSYWETVHFTVFAGKAAVLIKCTFGSLKIMLISNS